MFCCIFLSGREGDYECTSIMGKSHAHKYTYEGSCTCECHLSGMSLTKGGVLELKTAAGEFRDGRKLFHGLGGSQ